jgi:hypothetical protein
MVKQRLFASRVPIASPSLLRKCRIAVLAAGLPESEADEKAVELAAMVEAALEAAPSPDMRVRAGTRNKQGPAGRVAQKSPPSRGVDAGLAAIEKSP